MTKDVSQCERRTKNVFQDNEESNKKNKNTPCISITDYRKMSIVEKSLQDQSK